MLYTGSSLCKSNSTKGFIFAFPSKVIFLNARLKEKTIPSSAGCEKFPSIHVKWYVCHYVIKGINIIPSRVFCIQFFFIATKFVDIILHVLVISIRILVE